jgi:predicted phage terminase large subunit-like protein
METGSREHIQGSIDLDQLRAELKLQLAYLEFWEFCLLYDREFFRSRLFLQDVARSFQEIHEGNLKSLSVSMPPRAGKSYITSLFCAWILGRRPDQSVMRNTCTATLYLKFAYDVRAIIKTECFQEVFPGVELSDDKKNLQGWNLKTSRQVGYFGAGVGGTIIGFGCTAVGITDDLYRGIEDAMSDTINNKIVTWKQSTHDSRFESGCARIDIGTRWSVEDVIGINMDQGAYQKSIVIPALNDQGLSFCEAVMTSDEYEDKKNRTAPEIWSAEYMQEPVDIGGRLFNDLRYLERDQWDQIQENKQIDGAIAYIDVADQGKDYTAMAVLILVESNCYLVETTYSRENTDKTLPLCAGILDRWNVSYCRVESNSMGAMFSRHLQRMVGSTKILQVHNTTNKETRILMQSAWIQSQIQFVKREDRDSQLFLQGVLSYSKDGKNKNDDAPDCLAGLSIFAQSMFKKSLATAGPNLGTDKNYY